MYSTRNIKIRYIHHLHYQNCPKHVRVITNEEPFRLLVQLPKLFFVVLGSTQHVSIVVLPKLIAFLRLA